MADETNKQWQGGSASSVDGVKNATKAAKQDVPQSEQPQQQQKQQQPKQESKLKHLWTKIGLDRMTLQIMIKGSLAPTIAIAMYQSNAVAKQYQALGYLVAIASILGFAIMPRGKFIQTMFLDVITICLATAVSLLALYCSTQARLHTTPANATSKAAYNSSASAVCAIWLIVQIYAINALRASRPQFQFPAIIYSIFAIISMSYGPIFPNMTFAISFMKKVLEAFLTGFGLATGVHFFVFPTSSRTVVLKEMTGYLMCVTGLLKAQTAYMASLEDIDPVKMREEREKEEAAKKDAKSKKHKKPVPSPFETPTSLKVKEVFDKLMELHTKLNGDIIPAKREFAFGKLESHDLTELWKHLRWIFVPVIGLNGSINLLQRQATEDDLAHEGATKEERAERHERVDSVHFLMKQLHEPFERMTGEIETAISHVLITLELVKPPKKKKDEESKGDVPVPGSPAFAEVYRKRIDEFYHLKENMLRDWCREHGVQLPDNFFEPSSAKQEHVAIRDNAVRRKYQKQLFFILYLEYLLWRTSLAVLDLVLYADKRKQEGALKRSKLIFPGSKTLYKWCKTIFSQEDLSEDSHFFTETGINRAETVFLGKDFGRRKDLEHLPPRNTRERIGDAFRRIPQFFRSDDSAFGFRVACATMTIGIIDYLEASQAWFVKQRILWAMIMVAISMTRTSGQSIFNFVFRIAGTVIAMIGSYIIWYIVDGKVPGVIVFLWLWMAGAYYFILKFPKFIVVAILSLVTAVLVIGYELQVDKIGKSASESNGQPAYPTYELAPYRLATVCGGLFVAFIWTIFPYPITESSELRKDLGATLYLLSNFYSVIHETVQSRVRGRDGDPKIKGTHAYYLEKARNGLLSRLILILNSLKMNAAFSKFQMTVGGRFPREDFESLIEICQRLIQYVSLIGYSSSTFSIRGRDDDVSQWSSDFRELVATTGGTSHQITSLLSLLSSSITNGQSLPPFLEMPKPYQLAKDLESIDPDLLGIRHVAEVEYSAFAVLQICAHTVSRDVERLTKHVQRLVGVTDFSLGAVKTTADSPDTSSSELNKADDNEKVK